MEYIVSIIAVYLIWKGILYMFAKYGADVETGIERYRRGGV